VYIAVFKKYNKTSDKTKMPGVIDIIFAQYHLILAALVVLFIGSLPP
jgi:hypothetical protein